MGDYEPDCDQYEQSSEYFEDAVRDQIRKYGWVDPADLKEDVKAALVAMYDTGDVEMLEDSIKNLAKTLDIKSPYLHARLPSVQKKKSYQITWPLEMIKSWNNGR